MSLQNIALNMLAKQTWSFKIFASTAQFAHKSKTFLKEWDKFYRKKLSKIFMKQNAWAVAWTGHSAWLGLRLSCTKLMRLGVPNRIVNDMDFKPANFDRRFWCDSDFNNEIVSTIVISIKIWSNFILKSINFDWFWSKDCLNVDYLIQNHRI